MKQMNLDLFYNANNLNNSTSNNNQRNEFKVFYKTEKGVLYKGDCLEIMKNLREKFDPIILDPPYVEVRDVRTDSWNFNFNWHELFKQTHRLLKDNGVVFLFGLPSFYLNVSKYILTYFEVYFDLIWLKPQGLNYMVAKLRPLNRHEQILCLVKKNCRKSEITYNYTEIGEFRGRYFHKNDGRYDPYTGERKLSTESNGVRYLTTVIEAESKPHMKPSERTEHPTQKPEKLIEFLVKGWTNEGDKVLDPFLGSGTTAVVCERLNRQWLGIEIEEKWCRVAVERIKRAKSVARLNAF